MRVGLVVAVLAATVAFVLAGCMPADTSEAGSEFDAAYGDFTATIDENLARLRGGTDVTEMAFAITSICIEAEAFARDLEQITFPAEAQARAHTLLSKVRLLEFRLHA